MAPGQEEARDELLALPRKKPLEFPRIPNSQVTQSADLCSAFEVFPFCGVGLMERCGRPGVTPGWISNIRTPFIDDHLISTCMRENEYQ